MILNTNSPMHALFLIAKENFRDEELFEPQKILKIAGIETTITSIEEGMATGSRGGTVKIDKPIKDIHMEDYDILIAIGGPGAPALGDYEEVMNLIKKAHSLKKPLAAICIAPYLLARAGVITGKKATSFQGEPAISEFAHQGVIRIQQPILTDGDLITADGPSSAKDFGQEIIKLLNTPKGRLL